MIAAWMVLAAVLAGVVATGALGLEGVCRALRLPVRWAWVLALIVTAVLTAVLPLRRIGGASAAGIPIATTIQGGQLSGGSAHANTSPLAMVLDATRRGMDRPVVSAARAIAGVMAWADRWLVIAWVTCSVVLLVTLFVVLWRLAGARDAWPVAVVHGERVHVAPIAGPAAVGLTHGAIVVPAWLVGCSADAQRLVVAHEREHLRARDPLLLVLATVIAALVPWSPAVWWMLARLRLAVELDCDGRLLRAGTRAADYGELLIDLAGRIRGISPGAPLLALPMLVERPTHLERRIIAMSAPRPRHVALRIATGSLIALAATLVACESRMPTSVDVDNMTVASAERAYVHARMLSANDTLRSYYIDGFLAGASDAAALKPGDIASIAVRRDTADPSKGSVWITTRAQSDSAVTRTAQAAAHGKMYHVTMAPGAPGAKATYSITGGTRITADTFTIKPNSSRFAGIILVDGKRTESSAMKQLDPSTIQSIEVIKGARATELYPGDPAAAQGVIQITTKSGAMQK